MKRHREHQHEDVSKLSITTATNPVSTCSTTATSSSSSSTGTETAAETTAAPVKDEHEPNDDSYDDDDDMSLRLYNGSLLDDVLDSSEYNIKDETSNDEQLDAFRHPSQQHGAIIVQTTEPTETLTQPLKREKKTDFDKFNTSIEPIVINLPQNVNVVMNTKHIDETACNSVEQQRNVVQQKQQKIINKNENITKKINKNEIDDDDDYMKPYMEHMLKKFEVKKVDDNNDGSKQKDDSGGRRTPIMKKYHQQNKITDDDYMKPYIEEMLKKFEVKKANDNNVGSKQKDDTGGGGGGGCDRGMPPTDQLTHDSGSNAANPKINALLDHMFTGGSNEVLHYDKTDNVTSDLHHHAKRAKLCQNLSPPASPVSLSPIASPSSVAAQIGEDDEHQYHCSTTPSDNNIESVEVVQVDTIEDDELYPVVMRIGDKEEVQYFTKEEFVAQLDKQDREAMEQELALEIEKEEKMKQKRKQQLQLQQIQGREQDQEELIAVEMQDDDGRWVNYFLSRQQYDDYNMFMHDQKQQQKQQQQYHQHQQRPSPSSTPPLDSCHAPIISNEVVVSSTSVGGGDCTIIEEIIEIDSEQMENQNVPSSSSSSTKLLTQEFGGAENLKPSTSGLQRKDLVKVRSAEKRVKYRHLTIEHTQYYFLPICEPSTDVFLRLWYKKMDIWLHDSKLMIGRVPKRYKRNEEYDRLVSRQWKRPQDKTPASMGSVIFKNLPTIRLLLKILEPSLYDCCCLFNSATVLLPFSMRTLAEPIEGMDSANLVQLMIKLIQKLSIMIGNSFVGFNASMYMIQDTTLDDPQADLYEDERYEQLLQSLYTQLCADFEQCCDEIVQNAMMRFTLLDNLNQLDRNEYAALAGIFVSLFFYWHWYIESFCFKFALFHAAHIPTLHRAYEQTGDHSLAFVVNTFINNFFTGKDDERLDHFYLSISKCMFHLLTTIHPILPNVTLLDSEMTFTLIRKLHVILHDNQVTPRSVQYMSLATSVIRFMVLHAKLEQATIDQRTRQIVYDELHAIYDRQQKLCTSFDVIISELKSPLLVNEIFHNIPGVAREDQCRFYIAQNDGVEKDFIVLHQTPKKIIFYLVLLLVDFFTEKMDLDYANGYINLVDYLLSLPHLDNESASILYKLKAEWKIIMRQHAPRERSPTVLQNKDGQIFLPSQKLINNKKIENLEKTIVKICKKKSDCNLYCIGNENVDGNDRDRVELDLNNVQMYEDVNDNNDGNDANGGVDEDEEELMKHLAGINGNKNKKQNQRMQMHNIEKKKKIDMIGIEENDQENDQPFNERIPQFMLPPHSPLSPPPSPPTPTPPSSPVI